MFWNILIVALFLYVSCTYFLRSMRCARVSPSFAFRISLSMFKLYECQAYFNNKFHGYDAAFLRNIPYAMVNWIAFDRSYSNVYLSDYEDSSTQMTISNLSK